MKWWLIGCLGLILALGCGPQLGERPVMPTVAVGVASNGAVAPTRQAHIPTPNGPTSTPAPWATAIPTGLPAPAPLIPHDAADTDCYRCHNAPSGMPIPLDHFRRQPGTCLGCHRVEEGSLPPPALMPHPQKGHEACLICHLQGLNKAPIVPGDHAGRTNETCLQCHKPIN